MDSSLEEIPPFVAANFLEISAEVHLADALPKNPYKKPFLLPDTSLLLEEEAFAEIAMCYSKKGICVAVKVHKPFQEVYFPEVHLGDSIEIFIDTRDRKSAGTIHRFCHHFVFLPKEVEGMQSCEVTKFRLEDAHPLCDSSLLKIESSFKTKEYELIITIDKEALHGFDPEECPRLGFTYRVNRKGGSAQHFNLGSKEYHIEKHPSAWACLKLKK